MVATALAASMFVTIAEVPHSQAQSSNSAFANFGLSSKSEKSPSIAPSDALNTEPKGLTVPHADGKAVDYVIDEGGIQATVTTRLDDSGKLTLEINGTVDAVPTNEQYTVTDFVQTGENDDDFIARLQGQNPNNALLVDGQTATTQAFPALFILGILARMGLRYAIRWYGKTQIKKAAKSYVLRLNANKWKHILDPKHCWHTIGVRSREQAAEVIGTLMANGNHGPYKSTKSATMQYKGRTVTVTYANTGQISDAWVNERSKGRC